jgi:GT2 family glycosyltransferase
MSVRALSPNVDVVCHAERWFGGNSPDRIVTYGPAERATYESLLLDGNCVSTSATVIRKEILNRLGGFRENAEFITTEDYDLWLRVAQAHCTIAFIDDVLGSFRRHMSSASSSHLKHLRAEIAVVEDHFRLNSPQFDSQRKRRLAHAYYAAARSCSRAALGVDGFKLFSRSLTTYPWRARAWLGLFLHVFIMLRLPLNRRPHVN